VAITNHQSPITNGKAVLDRRAEFRHRLFVLAAVLTLWAAIIAVTEGFRVRIGPLSISSRSPRNPLLFACVAVGSAWMLAPAGRRSATAAGDVRAIVVGLWHAWTRAEAALVTRGSARWAAAFACVATISVVTIGFKEGALVAAASDAWGYVSEADRWANGRLRVEQPLMRELTPTLPADVLAPLAHRPSPDGTTIVPVVSPGLPMVMGLFQAIGGRDAVFVVVPLMAGVAIVATYLLGRRLAGPWTGVAAAVLLAASPSFLFQLTAAPMSDIPATAWWTLALAAVLVPGRWAALASGATAGAAVLTRSNLAPLAAAPAMLLLIAAWRG
jgi:4-amino-4-deoxy-L-arabinose transferase-like glycosyltransferase